MVRRAFKFPNAFQQASVAAGGRVLVYSFLVPAGGTGFVESVGLTVPNSSCFYRWVIDGVPVDEGNVSFQVGQLRSPTRYDPPLVVERRVEFWAYNDGTTEEVFEVLCDGSYYVEGM